ncbi:hypothetical protein LCGC14_0791920 [marine sediment metagenome]|uniref:Uncharacterized protein n=1 Tax=marine sediment metagenome TaxID=412755 RepID=A0A0F9QC20_9ZZZZ|nr:hypothetical protein [archaeon]
MSNETWNKLKKLKLTNFTDKTGKVCWSFYKNDLEKLLRPKPMTKTQKKHHNRMWKSIEKDLKEIFQKETQKVCKR